MSLLSYYSIGNTYATVASLSETPYMSNIPSFSFLLHLASQTYKEITSDDYLDYIKNYVVGIGPWKDTVVPVVNNYVQEPTDLVSRAHARDLQVRTPCLF